jgi:hypothetical protein
LETFFICPEENLSLLNSQIFIPDHAHLISVQHKELVKPTTQLFEEMTGFKRIPETSWRFDASMYRGLFILEYMINNTKFDWLVQSISAVFGPIGIYRVLQNFTKDFNGVPQFLGVQQESNCPMFKAWKSPKNKVDPADRILQDKLLTKVMYDATPQTYGTYEDLHTLLKQTLGSLTTINHNEFNAFLNEKCDEMSILERFESNGVHITLNNGEVIEKTGLMALFGAMKAIDMGTIAKGSSLLCCLTGGASDADGKALPECKITDLEMAKKYLLAIPGSAW